MKNWSMKDILANGLAPAEREIVPRDAIWASEIGTDMYARYQKMKGKHPSNKFTARTYFKFFVGDALENAITKVFRRCGMIVEVQKGGDTCVVETEGCFPVRGKYDLIISSDGDWDKALWKIENEPLHHEDSFVDRYSKPMALYCKENYPDGFEREIFEIKTINTNSLRAHLRAGTMKEAYYYHYMQIYTYMRHMGAKTGKILYISKDDGLFYIADVIESTKLENDWLEDVKKITNIIKNNIEPPFPKPYKMIGGKWKKDWFAIGNSFLTMGTGKTKDEMEKIATDKVKELNKELKIKKKEQDAKCLSEKRS